MIEAMKQALEALESCGEGHITDGGNQWHDAKLVDTAIASLRQFIKELESQEPVGRFTGKFWTDDAHNRMLCEIVCDVLPTAGESLYTHPPQPAKPIPCANHCEATAFEIVIKNLQGEIERLKASQRTWQGLTDDDDIDWEEGGNLKDLVKAIEAKLKEKNS